MKNKTITDLTMLLILILSSFTLGYFVCTTFALDRAKECLKSGNQPTYYDFIYIASGEKQNK